MPTRAKMTIISLYNYDDTLFDGLTVPAGDPDKNIPAVNKSVAIGKILIECAPFELMYPDLDFMKYAIANFSAVNARKWEKLLVTEYLDYNPIYNVDAGETETITRERTGTDGNTRTLDTKTTDDNTRTLDTENGIENTNKFRGFNSASLTDVSGNEGSDTQTGTITDNGTGSEKGTVTDAGNSTEKETITNSRIRKGNAGITMTQQMIEAERKTSDFSIYSVIADDFKNAFCCLIY